MSNPNDTLSVLKQWLEKAEHDFKNAENTLKMRSDCPFDTVCFHAQQCIEKYLKAFLLAQGIDFPKTHDLTELLAMVPQNIRLKIKMVELAEINPYAVETRYPGEWEPLTRQDAKKAFNIAGKVRKEIKRFFQTK